MQLRRRLLAKRSRPTLAVVMSTCLVAAAAFGGHQVLNTQSSDGDPVEVHHESASLASGANVVVDDPAVGAQGEPGPRTVKELTRDEEFSMFALTWTDAPAPVAFVRAELADGWGPWHDLEPLDEPSANGTTGTELIYIEPTHKVQVSTVGMDLVSDAAPEPVDYGSIKPVAEEQPSGPARAEDYNAQFIDGNAQAGIAPVAQTDGMPNIVSRASWRANEGWRCSQPTIDSHVSALTIHHTAGSNNYSPAQAAAQVRGIYNYHARTLGWCDIGYNALVDKFGTIYEGRYGGLTKAVQGAHAGGFNQNTWGISMMGDFTSITPPEATIEAVGKLAGWRAAVAGFDPTGSGTHYSEGTRYTKYPYDTAVHLPNIFAHRDVGLTTCPGDAGYAQMDRIRSIAKKRFDAIKAGHAGTPAQPQQNRPTAPANPVTPTTPKTEQHTDAGPLTGGDPEVTKILAGLSSQDRGEKVAALGGLAALGIAAALASPHVQAKLGELSSTPIVEGLTLSQVPAIVNKLVSLSGDSTIEKKWRSVRETFGPVLGAPRSGVTTTPGTGDSQTEYALFENGIITSSAETGAHALWGVIADTWAKQGFDLGPLGLPTSEEQSNSAGKLEAKFQGGSITYDPATGAVDINLG